jgi:CheY-like chemotaxis protein
MVLIVDDDKDLRELLGEILGDHGHHVVLARHGLAALECLRLSTNTTRDVVLLDLMMPVMGGEAFLREQRADVALRHIPVFLMTAAAAPAAIEASLRPTRMFVKPIDVPKLLGALAEYTCAEAPASLGGE